MLRSVLAALLCAAGAWGRNPAVAVMVDAGANRRAINPRIYGVAHASPATLSDLNAPLNRNGSAPANATSYSESVAKGNYSYRVQAYNQTTGRVSAYSNAVTVRIK